MTTLGIERPEIVDRPDAVEWIGAPRTTDEVLVYTIHDGAAVPRHLFGDRSEEILGRPEIRRAFVAERDWGADLVAGQLARALGLGGFLRVNLARLVMDYGRLPGSSHGKVRHLHRYSFYPPFGDLLSEQQKYDLLEHYYDAVSQAIGLAAIDKRITFAVHTYDRFNATGTVRPDVSLLSRLLEYSAESTLPPDVFDPLCPPDLCEEATAHRSLTYQMLHDLERGGHRTALNYPYLMPVGSTEIRGQVWFFFRHLRRKFLERRPETRHEAAFQLVWQMLLDVDQRSAEGARLRGFLHRYFGAPKGQQRLFLKAREAYAEIKAFLDANRRELVERYRLSPQRPSSIGIEVRKDLFYDLDADAGRVRERPEAGELAADIAVRMAGAVRRFLDEETLTRRMLRTIREPVLAAG